MGTWFSGLDKEVQKLIITTVLALIGGVLLLIMIKAGWLKNFSASKDGVKFSTRDSDDQSKLNAYNMSKDISEVDFDLKSKLRRTVSEIRLKLVNGMYEFGTCDLAKVAVSTAFYFPLMTAIDENHFRKKLARMHIDGYVNELLHEIELDYNGFCSMASNACAQAKVPAFADIAALVKKLLINHWITKVVELLIVSSENKITIYDSYLIQFTATGDKYNMNVCTMCKDKNKRYLEELKNV